MNLKPQKFDLIHLLAGIAVTITILFVTYKVGVMRGYDNGYSKGAAAVLTNLQQRGIIKIVPKTQEGTDATKEK